MHAGQFVDRVGVRLGLPFPSGSALEQLARVAKLRQIRLPSSVKGLTCSFSGQESQSQRLIEQGETPEEVAYAVYDCMARTFSKMLLKAMEQESCQTALLSGGVSGSELLRELLAERMKKPLLFAGIGRSSDNAIGTALLARDKFINNETELT